MSIVASRGSDQFALRLPDGLRDQIKADAAANGRSMNAEIIARLEGGAETLRDKAALAALPALLNELYASSIRLRATYDNVHKIAAFAAFETADAFMAARSGESA